MNGNEGDAGGGMGDAGGAKSHAGDQMDDAGGGMGDAGGGKGDASGQPADAALTAPGTPQARASGAWGKLPTATVGLLLAFLAYASWGLLSPVGKWLLDEGGYGPLGLNAVRFTFAAILVWACLGRRDRKAAWRLATRRDVLWFNLLANVSLTLFLYSLVTLPPAYATLGFYTAPLWTALWAWVRLGEKVGAAFLPAACGLLAGGYLALFGGGGVGLGGPSSGGGAGANGTGFAPGLGSGAMDAASVSTLGLALAIASGLVWAFYTVSLRRSAAAVALRPLMGASFALGAVYFLGLAVAVEGIPSIVHEVAAANVASWGWMALYVAVPTLASFILFNAALQRAPAGMVNLLVGAELAFTIVFSALLFDAHYSREQVLGLVIVLGSVTAYLWVRTVKPVEPRIVDAAAP